MMGNLTSLMRVHNQYTPKLTLRAWKPQEIIIFQPLILRGYLP